MAFSIAHKISQSTPENLELNQNMSIYFKNLDLSKINKRPKKPRIRKPTKPFPLKLYQMLEDVAQTGKEDIVGWAPDGLSFRVHDTEPFMKEVLPLYFNQTKYKSFQRQLNFYGFTRIIEGPLQLQGSYSNKFFIRGKREVCKNVTRQTNKTNNQRLQQTSSHFDDSPSLSPAHSRAMISIAEEPLQQTSLREFQQSLMSFNVADGAQQTSSHIDELPRLSPAHSRAVISIAEESLQQTSLREFQQSLMSFNVADALSDVDDDFSLIFEDYPKLQPQESILADGSKVSFIGKKFYFLEN
jgi:hypothetical protein